MSQKPIVLIVLLAALHSPGCQTTTKEQSSYSLSDAKGDSILDSRLKKLESETVKYPLRSDLWYQIAAVHFQKPDFRRSAEALEKAIEIAPGEAKYHFQLGRVYLTMNELEAAERHFRQASACSKQDRYTGPRAALGWTLALRKDVDGAIAEFKKCVEIESGNPMYYYFLGSLHDMKGDRESTIRYLQEYLALGGTKYHKKAVHILESLGVHVEPIQGGRSARSEELFEALPGAGAARVEAPVPPREN